MLNPDVSEFLERFKSTQFGHGETSYERADCIGLIILYLKHTGKQVLWEDRLPRRLIRYQGLQELIWSLPFKEANAEQINREVTTFLWVPGNTCAHIGLRIPLDDNDDEDLGGLVYHMCPSGLKSERVNPRKGTSAIYRG